MTKVVFKKDAESSVFEERGQLATYHVLNGMCLFGTGVHGCDFVITIVTTIVFKVVINNDRVMSTASYRRYYRYNRILIIQQ